MTDQQRFDTIAATGNPVIRTPNLDRLCRMGIGFRAGYTPQPLCGPARHSLFTGVDTRSVGDMSRVNRASWSPNGRFFTEVLAEAGICTGGFGKMHFFPERAHHGFQHYAVHEEQGDDAYREDDDYLMYLKAHGYGHIRYAGGVRGLLYFQPQISPIPEEHHETTWVADRAIDFIRTFHKKPFFCFASWMQPHWPVHVPASFSDLYDLRDIPEPVYHQDESVPFVAEMNRVASDLFDGGKASNHERLLRSKSLYYASISFIDKQVGRILDVLEMVGALDNTLIIFTADHGESLGDHRAFGKMTAYEPVLGVPFIVAGPGIEKSTRPSDELVSLSDVLPTVCEFLNVTPPPQNRLVGASLLGGRERVRIRDRVFFEMGDGSKGSDFVGVRTRRWKYAFFHGGSYRQLFDMANDRNELNNLAENPSPEHRRIMDELHDCLLAWNAEHGLSQRIENGDFRTVARPPMPPDRNAQYDRWVDHLPENEKAQLWSEARNVYEVIKNEKHLNPADLDLEFWESKHGVGCIAELETLLKCRLR